jgi:hypothetical protein
VANIGTIKINKTTKVVSKPTIAIVVETHFEVNLAIIKVEN